MSDTKAKARARSSARWARAAAIIPTTPLDAEHAAALDRIMREEGMTKTDAVRAALMHFGRISGPRL